MADIDIGELERLFARRMATNKMAEFAALNHSLAEAVPALLARLRTLEAALRPLALYADEVALILKTAGYPAKAQSLEARTAVARAALDGSGKESGYG